ncbi:MAG TPA: hypothetical protein VKN35_02140 [Xanthomonadales bacterium]|nr:hypothetical protein [Xanthomonadales bacterium]
MKFSNFQARTNVATLLLAILFFTPVTSLAVEWPAEIEAKEGSIIIYQPQPEKLEGNVLAGRAAMSLELNSQEEPIFGAFWFRSRIETDTDAGIVTVLDLKVTKVTWADSTDAGEQRFTSLVEGAMPDSGFEISLDRLSASLATADQIQKSLDDLKNDPPAILFREELSVLLIYEGEPGFSPVEDSPYERALNTPFLVVRDTQSGECYLSSGTSWYEAENPLGDWVPTASPPADLLAMIPEPEEVPEAEDAPAIPPKIVTATKPTELISTQGKPQWDSLPGGELLFVSNTETPWMRELSTQNMYVLLSGRWYRSRSQEGPWTFVRADELPASFRDIPPASDIGGLRVSVAGTEEAEQAMLDAQIPQTAAIKRNEATLKVEYDGSPEFEKISGTQVSYAVNTGAQVLEIENRYYAVDNGVWFTSAAATGPWVVADEIPNEAIQQIPPSAPVYNTTYVQVYQSTPEVVYVGYTPGYMWSFPYYGVPVYGTGWYYPPYWGRYYYPRTPTWGLHVGYNPWTGWNFGVSWGWGFMRVGVGWGGGWGGYYRPGGCCGGWYGGGYRRPVVINTGNINIGNSINIGNRNNINNRISNNRVANNASISNRKGGNLYDRPANRARNASPAVAKTQWKDTAATRERRNNVYADPNGNVARHTKDGWQERSGGGWKNVAPATRETATAKTRPTTTARPSALPSHQSRPQLNQRDLNRSRQARQTGASRQRAQRSRGGRGRRNG